MSTNLIMKDGRYQALTIAAASSGDPKMIGQLAGVAEADRDGTSGKAVFDLGPGVYDLSAKAIDDAGNSAIALGDRLFYVSGDTPVLSKKASGNFFGYALEAVSSGSTDTINVMRPNGTGIGLADLPYSGYCGINITDPGDTKAIPVTNTGICPITTAGAETRTLAAPSFIGQEITLILDVYAGDAVVTVASAINQTGNNTITMDDAGDTIRLQAVQKAGALVWRVVFNDGTSLSTV